MQVVLYSGSYCPYSHRCRLVLREKQMESGVEIYDVDLNNKPENLALYNPYNRVPVFVDRETHLFESNIINEYLNDRFPHPQLMPADIFKRARLRLLMYQFDREIFQHVDVLEKKNSKRERREKARLGIKNELLKLAGALADGREYLIDSEFSLLDAALAPLLWRLEHYKISLPAQAKPLSTYAQRVFSRPAFGESLTSIEKAMCR